MQQAIDKGDTRAGVIFIHWQGIHRPLPTEASLVICCCTTPAESGTIPNLKWAVVSPSLFRLNLIQ